MPSELVGSNLVIAAHQFNPSILSQLWLVRNEILSEEGFQPGCLFSDQVVNAEARDFGLLVVPPQLQFTPKVPPEAQGHLVASKVGAIVRALPHTPYTAIGLNFFWRVDPDKGDVSAFTRSLFFDSHRKIYPMFDEDNARFGGYFSKDTLGCRLKLDVKPINRRKDDESEEFVQFAFNFHLDLPQEGERIVPAIEQQLGIWDEAASHAARILQEATL